MPRIPRGGQFCFWRALGVCWAPVVLTVLSPFAGLGSAGAAEAEAPPAPRVLTLSEAVKIALENNRNVQAALQRANAARARVDQAAAPNRPQARLSGSVTRNDKETTLSLPGGPGGAVQQVTIGQLYTSGAQLAVTKAIDVSGALRLQRSIAELSGDVAVLDLARAQEQTVLEVKNAFIGVLRAEAALGVARANAASLEEHLSQVRAFFGEGVVAQYDVLRAEAQAAN
ncbi:MAG: TolC family protein, partial [Armatimonadota bacterium]|nr:TolC family protein [Armatimonadota bacterium]